MRHLFAAYDLATDRLYGHIKDTKTRTQFLAFCRYLRSLYRIGVRLAIACDNFSPHLTTNRCGRVANWAEAITVEIAYTPTNSSWLNRIEVQFTAPRYFAHDSTDHASHREKASMDPPIHHLAKQTRRQRTVTSDRQQGKRCLMRHSIRRGGSYSLRV